MSALVFVADDEPELREIYSEILESGGFEVVTFPTGDALLDGLRDRTPDVVVLDINMPGLSGWDVQARLSEAPATAHVPVIAVTANGGSSVTTSAIRTLGFRAFVRKPFSVAELLQAVGSAIAPA